MVTALRKIRKKLMEQNRARRYFFYAIGEIVLVVIGILIALQINTWNKEKQNRVHERTILKNLVEDLEIQKELIQEQVDYESDVLQKIDSAKMYISDNFDKAILGILFNELAGRHTFKANRATFNNMISSGSINLVKEENLQNSIVRYFQRLDYVESVVNNNNLYMVDSNFGAFVANNGLGLEFDEHNNIVGSTNFNNKHKATLLSQLTYRGSGSDSAKSLNVELLGVTNDLIKKIERYLK